MIRRLADRLLGYLQFALWGALLGFAMARPHSIIPNRPLIRVKQRENT